MYIHTLIQHMNTVRIISLLALCRIFVYYLYYYYIKAFSRYSSNWQEDFILRYVPPVRQVYPLFHGGRTFLELIHESYFIKSNASGNSYYSLDSIQVHPLVLKPLAYYLFKTPIDTALKYFTLISAIDVLIALSLGLFIKRLRFIDKKFTDVTELSCYIPLYYMLNPVTIIANFSLSLDNLHYLIILLLLLLTTFKKSDYTKLQSILEGKFGKFHDMLPYFLHKNLFLVLLALFYQSNCIQHACTVFAIGFIMYQNDIKQYKNQTTIKKITYGAVFIASFFVNHLIIRSVVNLLGESKFYHNISQGHYKSAYYLNLSVFWYPLLVTFPVFVKFIEATFKYHMLIYIIPLIALYKSRPMKMFTILSSISFLTSDTFSVPDLSFCMILILIELDHRKKEPYIKKVICLVISLGLTSMMFVTTFTRSTTNPNFYFFSQFITVGLFVIILCDYLKETD